jgi:hypothetical protein
MDERSFDRLTLRLGRLVSRRAALGGLGASGLAVALGGSAFDTDARKRKRKKRKKTCPRCQAPETCPDRVCCECTAQSPASGCRIVDVASNPSPSESIAACDGACGGAGMWSGGNTSYTAGGLTAACDADNHCLRIRCPL